VFDGGYVPVTAMRDGTVSELRSARRVRSVAAGRNHGPSEPRHFVEKWGSLRPPKTATYGVRPIRARICARTEAGSVSKAPNDRPQPWPGSRCPRRSCSHAAFTCTVPRAIFIPPLTSPSATRFPRRPRGRQPRRRFSPNRLVREQRTGPAGGRLRDQLGLQLAPRLRVPALPQCVQDLV
jgi:hypothetical protein